jgi:hypothetical protein
VQELSERSAGEDELEHLTQKLAGPNRAEVPAVPKELIHDLRVLLEHIQAALSEALELSHRRNNSC